MDTYSRYIDAQDSGSRYKEQKTKHAGCQECFNTSYSQRDVDTILPICPLNFIQLAVLQKKRKISESKE